MVRTKKELEEAVEQLKKLNADEEVRRIAMAEEWAEIDRISQLSEALQEGEMQGMAKGREEGKAEGKAEEKSKIAKKMLAQGIAIEIIETVTGLRATYFNNSGNNIKVAENLNNSMNKLIGVAENYPELKASEQFLNLQKNLSKLESQLQAARRIYNNEVTDYNTLINTVPTNILAKIFNFKEAELFKIEDYKKENVQVELG